MRTRHFQSGLAGFLSGGLWAGIVGAILFGLRAYFSDSSSTLGGADRNWTWHFAIFGLVFGFAVGAILGAILGALHADRRVGIFIGVAIGLLIAVVLSNDNAAPLVFAVIASCVVLGWLTASTFLENRPEENNMGSTGQSYVQEGEEQLQERIEKYGVEVIRCSNCQTLNSLSFVYCIECHKDLSDEVPIPNPYFIS
jgi:hypothetical protein